MLADVEQMCTRNTRSVYDGGWYQNIGAGAVATYVSGGTKKDVPVKEKTLASNGLTCKSNPKHTLGQPENRPNAGIEPRTSLKGLEVPNDIKNLFHLSKKGW